MSFAPALHAHCHLPSLPPTPNPLSLGAALQRAEPSGSRAAIIIPRGRQGTKAQNGDRNFDPSQNLHMDLNPLWILVSF